jgi:hypothetical protein
MANGLPDDQTSAADTDADERIEFLTFDDVCEIHDRGLMQFGAGAAGFVDEHVVRSASGRLQPLHNRAAASPVPGGFGFLPTCVLKLCKYATHIIDSPCL